MSSLLADILTWSLPAGVEINPDGSGFRLTRQTIYDDLTIDKGLALTDRGVPTTFGVNSGELRTANQLLEFVGSSQDDLTRALLSVLNVTGDFKLDFSLAMHIGNGFYAIGIADSAAFPFGYTGDLMYAGLVIAGPTMFLDNRTAGVFSRAAGSISPGSKGEFFYGTLERISGVGTLKMFDDRGRTVQTGGTLTLNPVNTGTLTDLFISAIGPGQGASGPDTFQVGEFELWPTGVTTRYLTTSPVIEQGWVSKSAGTVIRGIGDLPFKVPSGTSIQAAYRANNGAWTAPFASVALMNADLLANPVTITDIVNSFDVRFTLVSTTGDNTPEIFVIEGPDLTQVITPADFPDQDDVRDGVFYDGGSLEGNLELPIEPEVLDGVGYGSNGTERTGTLEPTTIALPLEVIEIETLEVIKL